MSTTIRLPGTIIKRSGQQEGYDAGKIRRAIQKAFEGTATQVDDARLDELTATVENLMAASLEEGGQFSVERVQDMAEQALMQAGYFTQAKAYILYRDVRRKKR